MQACFVGIAGRKPEFVGRKLPPTVIFKSRKQKMFAALSILRYTFPLPRCKWHCATDGEAERCPSWPKEHDWKSCMRQKRIWGSNPHLSAILNFLPRKGIFYTCALALCD